MSINKEKLQLSVLEDLHTSGAGFDILRYVAIPELMGEDASTLLYFMGKNITRKFDIKSIDDLRFFFGKLGIGQLDLFQETRNKKVFHLLADSVVLRIKSPIKADFQLESGLIAEAMEKIDGVECECVAEINKRLGQVVFTVFYSK